MSVSEWSTRFAMLQAGDADEVAVPVENRPQVDPLAYETCVFNLETEVYDCEVTNPDGTLRLYLGRPGTSRTDIFLNFDIAAGSNYIGSGQLDGNGIPSDFFSDVHIRRAFAYCFDWDVYINDIFNGEAIQSPVLPMFGMPGYDANQETYYFDAAKCEEEFKLADVDKDGIPAGEDPDDVWEVGFRLQALYNQGNTTRQTIGEILGANLSEVNSKFVIETVGVPWPSFLRTFRGGLGPVMASGWVEDIHDPHNWYVPYMTGTYAFRQNLPAELREQFSAAINEGVAATDPAERQAIYEPLNQLYFEQVPTILLAVGTSHGYEQAYVHGTVLNPALFGNYYYPMYKK
jgi:peptide/nickel transport system substrate-binding protein